MASYQPFVSARLTEPHFATLEKQLQATDATIGVIHTPGSADYVLKKTTAWSAPQIAAAQTTIDTAPAATGAIVGQSAVDAWPVEFRALVLALIDQLNVIRAALPVPLGPITPAQAIAAVRAKAGTL